MPEKNRSKTFPPSKDGFSQSASAGRPPPEIDVLIESFESAPFGILVHDDCGRILVFNSQLEQISGFRRQEIRDVNTWIETVYPDGAYRELVLKDRRRIAPGELRIRDAMITRRDGTKRICQFASRQSETGIRTVFVQDTQGKMQLLRSLLESQEKFKTLYLSNPVPTLSWIRMRDDFALVSYNLAAEALTAGAIVRELGKNASDVFAGRPDINANIQRCFTEKRRFTEESQFDLPNSEDPRHFQLTYTYAPPDFVFLHVEDITRLRQTEKELAQSEKRFEELVDLLPETVFEFDLNGRFVYANRAAFEQFGFSPQDLAEGRNMLELLVPEERKKAMHNMARVLGGEQIGLNEYTVMRKDASSFPAMLRSSAIIQDGRPVGIRGFLIDITERKQLEQELVRARDELELRVTTRTRELEIANRILLTEIAERRRVEETLRRREKDLQNKAEEMKEINTALRVVLRKSASDREALEEKMLLNVKKLVMPVIEKIKHEQLTEKQRAYMAVLENNLREIVSPMTRELTQSNQLLTPTEIQIANFIKQGKTSKEIAGILYLSSRTIESHRKNIRRKLGLKNKKVNLRTHLLSMDSD